MYWCAPELASFDHDWELDLRDLRRNGAEIKLQLRTNGGHRGKVSPEMLIWLDEMERVEDQIMKLLSSPERRGCCYSRSKVYRAKVKLGREVKSLLLNASSLLVSYGNGAIDRVAEQWVSPTLVGQSAQSILNQVCDYLADPKVRIIGLYGEGGVGKTTIMRNLNNLLMNTDMFDKIFWVTLSQSATIESVQDQIALQLGITLPSQVLDKERLRFEKVSLFRYTKWAEEVLARKHRGSLISDNLKNLERCLFLLDDMWVLNIKGGLPGSDFLTSIWIPEKGTGSRCNYKVVLTTRSSQVCQQMRAQKQIFVSPLSENEAWDLFVSRSGNHVFNSEICHIAEEIVNECKGLPITVITIAHAMREEVISIAWIHALKDIRGTNDVDVHVDKRISDLLRFGYSHLKNERVQNCFLYCAFFPEDFQFEARELIQYWIAEELVCEESIVASIDVGYQILKEIIDANMLEPDMRGGDVWVRMHDLFRDLAVSIMTQELGFLVPDHGYFRKLDDILANKKKASLIGIRNKYLSFQDMMSAATDLSTLLLRDNPLRDISSSFFDRLYNLQVLDLSYIGIKELPNSVYHLSKLRVLFLQYCTCLEKLSSLEYCKELQFLNLRGTLIKELPPGMEKLIKLRSLDLSQTVRLENIQEGLISSLSNLEELQMQGSLLCKLKSPMIANHLKEIRCLEKLAILTLSVVGFEDHLDTILHLQGHNLMSFSINVYGSTQDYNEDV